VAHCGAGGGTERSGAKSEASLGVRFTGLSQSRNFSNIGVLFKGDMESRRGAPSELDQTRCAVELRGLGSSIALVNDRFEGKSRAAAMVK